METMANKMRLIDGNEALRMMRNSQHDTPCTDNAGKNVWKVAHDCAISCVEACSTVIAYTEEQVASILQQSDQLRSENQALEKECAWLKSCLNCKIRRECPRHCGKVVHGCDHWEYGYSTVDAVEVVHGRWEYWAGGLAQCPVCGYEYTDYLECKNYCGNCGAKMDGGNEDG